MMEQINIVVSRENRAALVYEYYPIGKSREGIAASPALELLQGMVLHKWFLIPSDPELANQINDRISFRRCLGLPFDKPFPDHATVSRFRSRLPEEAMIDISHELMLSFSSTSLAINGLVARDARCSTFADLI
ncbi:MAG: transposase [Deltaproteobacteria bacterium]|nr:MAG: transposase [Deltaproteobacteria bacterium]